MDYSIHSPSDVVASTYLSFSFLYFVNVISDIKSDVNKGSTLNQIVKKIDFNKVSQTTNP